jgi:phage shock protein PspC (stress-responsive transcriptional regulator)
MVAGVCGGVAKLFGVDAALLRILLVAATLFGFGAGALLYLACWILMPEEAL